MTPRLLAITLTLAAVAHAAHPEPLKVFILAGQSNMEGQAVVDLTGKNYNDRQGTLTKLMEDAAKAPTFAHLKRSDGKWTVREDVWVRYQRENRPLLAGPLTFGFSVYGDVHHFGPELQFGHVVGDAFQNQVLLIKTAWGGKSLYRDFRPPGSGGETGLYYTKMIAGIREAMAKLKTDFPSYDGRGCERRRVPKPTPPKDRRCGYDGRRTNVIDADPGAANGSACAAHHLRPFRKGYWYATAPHALHIIPDGNQFSPSSYGNVLLDDGQLR